MKTINKIFKATAFENRKIGAVILTTVMILSVLMILTVSTEPASAASGSVIFNPSVFSNGQSTLVVANGGSFTSGATVYFYISSTDSFGSSSAQVGYYTLSTGTTSLSNAVFQMTLSKTPGTYYLAASDDNRATFTSGYAITVTSLAPSLTVSSSASAGGTVSVTGKQFDPGSTITIYLQYASGQTVASNVVAATGYFTTSINIPTALYQTSSTYYVVAQETSSSSLNYGVTAFSSVQIRPSVTASPSDVSPSALTTLVINGYGFYPGATVSTNSVSLSPQTGSISGATNLATTVGLNGQVSITETFNSVSALGAVTVGITTSPSSSSSSFSTVFYVSQENLTKLGFTFSAVPTTGSTYNVGNSVTATVYNFPSSQTVQIYLGSTVLGFITTDANGYGSLTSTIPAIPGGIYNPTAEVNSMGVYMQASSTLTISADFMVSTPGNVALNTNPSEYIPSNGLLTVSAFGLSPVTSTYNVDDSLVASGGVYVDGSGNLVTSVSVGSEGTGGLSPAPNGTLIFTYSPQYSTSTTGTSSGITMTNSVSAYSSNSYGYRTIGTPTVSSPSSFAILTQGTTNTYLTVSGLVPFQSPVYPGTSYYYAAYLGSLSLSLTYSSITNSMFYASGGSFSGTFTVPYLTGSLDINITYSTASYSDSLGLQHVVISVIGSSYSSGTLRVIPLSTAGTYEVVGYGYYLKNPTLYYTKNTGPTSVGTETLTNGAFAVQISLGSSLPPAGTYSVFTVLTYSGATYFVYSSYTIAANLTLSSYSGPIGSTITVQPTSSGLISTTYYNVYLGNYLVLTDSGTVLDGSSPTFTVPTVMAGDYTINVVPLGQTSAVESAGFTVTANSDLVLGTDSNYAFPGQLVSFTINGVTAPALPSGGETAVGLATSYVTVGLNSSDYQTVQATYYNGLNELTGSFVMPNDNPGSYYELTMTAFELQPVSYSIVATSTTTGFGTITIPYSVSESDFLGLVSGNGALVTGISESQIATLETDINATLSVPVAQLDASVVSIQNSVAEITTAFGTMQASLNSIDATVTTINSGIATLETTLGQVETSLGSLNSTIVALNGDTVQISSVLGSFNTSLSGINAQITISNGKLAVIQTDLGTFTGNVTSVSNGIATIQTSLGTIKTNTNQILPSYGTSFILEIIILVLVAIAVVFSALAMMNRKR